MTKNYGLIHEPIVPNKDWIFGSALSAGGTPLQPTGQWDDFLPLPEDQDLNGIEPYACVTFATHHAIEILKRRQFGASDRYSNRFVAKATGTDVKMGNSPQAVAEFIRTKGTVLETLWPFDSSITTFEQFYAALPQNLFTEALTFPAQYVVNHEYVPTSATMLKAALQYSPLTVSLFAWEQGPDGIYIRPPGEPDDHCVVVYGYLDGVYWKVFDSYSNELKKYAWDAGFGVAKRFAVTNQVVNQSAFQNFLSLLLRILFPKTSPPPLIPPPPSTVPPTQAPFISPILWDTTDNARHSVRVICDEEGMTLEQKNTMCATIAAESGFNTQALNYNKDSHGIVLSIDYGICQVNDYYHIGPGKDFPSVDYVLKNPEACVRWMAKLWKAGKRNLWAAYNNGSYKKYL